MFHTLVLHLQALTRCYMFTLVQFRPASPRGVIIKLWERINKGLIHSHLVVQLWTIFSVAAILSEEVPLCTCTSGMCWIYSTASKWWFLNPSVGVLQPFSGCASTFQKSKSVECTLHSNWTAKNLLSCTCRPSSHQPWQCEIQNLGQLEAEVGGWWEIAARTVKFVRTGHPGRDLKIAATLEDDWEDDLMRLAKYKSGKAFEFYEYVRKFLIKCYSVITDMWGGS